MAGRSRSLIPYFEGTVGILGRIRGRSQSLVRIFNAIEDRRNVPEIAQNQPFRKSIQRQRASRIRPVARTDWRRYFSGIFGPVRFNGNGWALVRCCFHSPDRHPSLSIHRDGGFTCHACGVKGGSVIDFEMLPSGPTSRPPRAISEHGDDDVLGHSRRAPSSARGWASPSTSRRARTPLNEGGTQVQLRQKRSSSGTTKLAGTLGFRLAIAPNSMARRSACWTLTSEAMIRDTQPKWMPLSGSLSTASSPPFEQDPAARISIS